MDGDLGKTTVSKVVRRLIPFIMVLMIINFIDRLNISYAALRMNKDLGIDPQVYGLVAGIFFAGYFFFEIPSNLIMARVGARRWIARICVTWGILATGMAFINGVTSLCVMRFLLGVAEAGFLPGIFFYLGRWIPAQQRGKIFSYVMSSTAITLIIGGPVSTAILGLDGWLGLKGWQLMFIIEGVPSIVLGFVVLGYLTESPEEASWLEEREKRWLSETLRSEQAQKEKTGATTLTQGLLDPRVWLITALCFFLICDNFGTVFWLPQIINAFGGLTPLEVGFLSAVPFIAGAAGMILWGRHSDQSGDRKWHLVTGAVIGAIGFTLAALAPTSVVAFVGLCIAALGIWGMFGVFWALSGDLTGGLGAAGGLALINSFGTLGGFVAPIVIGFLRSHSTGFSTSLLALAGSAVVTAVLALFLKNELPTQAAAGKMANSAIS